MKLSVFLIILFTSVAFCGDEGIKKKASPSYDELITLANHRIGYDFYGASSLSIGKSVVKTGSIGEISKYLREQKIKSELLVVTISKPTHMNLSSNAEKDVAKMISDLYSDYFHRVLVQLALSDDGLALIYDSAATNPKQIKD